MGFVKPLSTEGIIWLNLYSTAVRLTLLQDVLPHTQKETEYHFILQSCKESNCKKQILI